MIVKSELYKQLKENIKYSTTTKQISTIINSYEVSSKICYSFGFANEMSIIFQNAILNIDPSGNLHKDSSKITDNLCRIFGVKEV